MRLIDAPVGLLMYDGCLAFKTEYSTVIQAESGEIVTPDCYVVESGEYFWGGAKTAEDRNNLNVEPIELPHALLDNCPTIDSKGLQPVVRCWKCRHWHKGHCTYGLSPCCTLQTYANYYCPYGAKEANHETD